MTTLVASTPPVVSSLANISLASSSSDRRISPLRNGIALSHPATTMSTVNSTNSTPRLPRSSPKSNSPPSRTLSDGKSSPNSDSFRAPMIRVKKEPASPHMSSRPRPRRLDLSSSGSARQGPQTAGAGPLTSKESAGLAIKDLGVACLSPGFQTQDPAMREQLQRSLSVRDQQRMLIEARHKGGSTKPLSTHDSSEPASSRPQDTPMFGSAHEGPQSSKRKGPPPGLTIHAPSASSFSNERVIQSAPLGQSFTGLRPGGHPHPHHQPSGLGQTSHIHHVPATQTTNRLPPISDVFAGDRFDNGPPSAGFRPNLGPGQPSPSYPPPMHSPGYPPSQANHTHQLHQHQQQQPPSSRSREYRSAEEAMQGMSGGREELLPKIVHYGGTQPPTPPSPMPNHHHHHHHHAQHAHAHHPPAHAPHAPPHSASHYDSRPELSRTSSISGRRRTRDEYERENGSPNANNGEPKRYARDEEDWRAGMNSAQKREEFLRLCERAWDLFHS